MTKFQSTDLMSYLSECATRLSQLQELNRGDKRVEAWFRLAAEQLEDQLDVSSSVESVVSYLKQASETVHSLAVDQVGPGRIRDLLDEAGTRIHDEIRHVLEQAVDEDNDELHQAEMLGEHFIRAKSFELKIVFEDAGRELEKLLQRITQDDPQEFQPYDLNVLVASIDAIVRMLNHYVGYRPLLEETHSSLKALQANVPWVAAGASALAAIMALYIT